MEEITHEMLTRGLAADWRQRLQEWPLPLPRFTIDLQRATLLVVDMQYDSAEPDLVRRYAGRPGIVQYRRERAPVVLGNIERLVGFFREVGRPLVYLTVGHARPDRGDALPLLRQIDDDLRARNAPGPLVRFGSDENRIVASIAPRPEDLVINKTSMGAFNSTNIDQTLRNLGVTTLVVTGVSTECCVATTAHDAADRGYHVLLVEDACRAVTPYLQECSLVIFAAMFGRVATTEETLRELRSAIRC